MIFFENITFLTPIYFLWVIPLFIFIVFIYFKKEQNTYFLWLSELQKVYGRSAVFYKLYFILLFCISVVFLSLLAHPVEYLSEEKIKKNGIDIEIVMDLSYSMIAEDLQPNRLEVAKKVTSDFIDSRVTDRIGLILFSGKPFTSVPLTFDYDFLREYISQISIESIDRSYGQLWWTAIWDGLILAYDTLKSDEWLEDQEAFSQGEKIIILITDWEANTGIDPIIAIKALKEHKIRTYTIWVWWLDETFIELVDDFGFKNKFAVGWIDEDTLKKIAAETWGQYYRATSQQALENIFDSISELETREIEQDVIEKRVDRHEPFLYILIFLFLLLFILIYRKNINIW